MNIFKNNQWLSVLTILLLVVNIITLTMLWANNKKEAAAAPVNQPPGGQVFEFVTKELSLNEQQRQQYKILRDEHQRLQRPLADSIKKARDTFFDLLKNMTVKDSVVALYNKKTIALQEQLDLVNFKHFQKLRAICDTRQQQKFDEILQTILRRIGGPRPPRKVPDEREGSKFNNFPPTDNQDGPAPNGEREGEQEPPPPREK